MDLLPAKHGLLAACRGNVQNSHPLLHWASELSEIHEQLAGAEERAETELAQRRVSLIHDIDQWVGRQLPPSHGGARIHTESLGAVIDRLAAFTACACAALKSTGGEELRDTWERLAELAVGYEDLKDEVLTGRRRLPRTH
ncbi:DUF4254 domain-containing protein [Nocardia sp. SYP-A9097]|uniref:DUF4254 domain-containing protein n=1 Tax=Nocardia sp. SYP-A9097 TaxID=2663237 RepID=UPI00129A9BC4|nr:DUF4254 domain-containing protein [Nocardia sp. SYP-A9097]MRH92879.1 DUF4254 domain-containing protein [Nocardia sp. SYP-A9097]